MFGETTDAKWAIELYNWYVTIEPALFTPGESCYLNILKYFYTKM